MLFEAFVALIALVTVMIASPAVRAPAGAIYGQGIGQFLTVVLGREHLLFATIFGTMAFSTFVFDTLDVATRLGRYILQELFDWRGRTSAAHRHARHRRRCRCCSCSPPSRPRPGSRRRTWPSGRSSARRTSSSPRSR